MAVLIAASADVGCSLGCSLPLLPCDRASIYYLWQHGSSGRSLSYSKWLNMMGCRGIVFAYMNSPVDNIFCHPNMEKPEVRRSGFCLAIYTL